MKKVLVLIAVASLVLLASCGKQSLNAPVMTGSVYEYYHPGYQGPDWFTPVKGHGLPPGVEGDAFPPHAKGDPDPPMALREFVITDFDGHSDPPLTGFASQFDLSGDYTEEEWRSVYNVPGGGDNGGWGDCPAGQVKGIICRYVGGITGWYCWFSADCHNMVGDSD